MAFARGRFGIEYNPRPVDDESSGLGWIVVAIALAALVLLLAAVMRRLRSDDDGQPVAGTVPVAVPYMPSVRSKSLLPPKRWPK